jgi:hypothetical protein
MAHGVLFPFSHKPTGSVMGKPNWWHCPMITDNALGFNFSGNDCDEQLDASPDSP